MKTVAAFLLCAALLVPSSRARASGDETVADDAPEWRILEHTVQEILTGTQPGPRSARIAPGAQLAIGDSLLDLEATVAAGQESVLRANVAKPPVNVRSKMNPEKNAAVMLLGIEQGSEMRYHTVVFIKDAAGAWLVESWHASR